MTNQATDRPESADHPTLESPRASRRWWLLLALPLTAGALSVTIAGTTPAMAFGGGGPRHGQHDGFAPGRMVRVLNDVGASDAQKTQIKDQWEKLRPQMQALRADGDKLRDQMKQALAAPTIDANRIEQLRREQVQHFDKRSALMTQALLASAQVLTPQQRAQVAERMDHHDRKGGRGDGPGAGGRKR